MSLFADAGNFLSTAVESLGGVEGTYRRGEEFAIPVKVAWGSKLFVSHDGYGAAIRSTQRYGLIRSELLNHDGEAITPEVGDRIEVAFGGILRTYEVCENPDGQHYDYSDEGESQLRIYLTDYDRKTQP